MIALPNIEVHSQIYLSANSVVYRGVSKPDNTPIILKVFKQDYPTPGELTRYKQEYEITRSLNVEGAIKVYSIQEYQRTLVMLLEDFGGESLAKLCSELPAFSPMPLADFLLLAIQIAEILGNIHSSNVIHKDINPSNIVLNRATGTVKIIDFGIATRFARTNPSFKNPNVLEGTLAYISPEQTERMNRMLDYRTDFYSLGATFYELLVGQLLFVATRFAVGRFGNAQINRVDDERSLITIFVFDWSVSGLGSELNSSIDLLHESRKQSKFIIEESSNQVAT